MFGRAPVLLGPAIDMLLLTPVAIAVVQRRVPGIRHSAIYVIPKRYAEIIKSRTRFIMKRGQEVIQMGEVEKNKKQKIIYVIEVSIKYNRSLIVLCDVGFNGDKVDGSW